MIHEYFLRLVCSGGEIEVLPENLKAIGHPLAQDYLPMHRISWPVKWSIENQVSDQWLLIVLFIAVEIQTDRLPADHRRNLTSSEPGGRI